MNTTLPAGWKLVPEVMPLEMSVAFAEAWYSKRRAIDDDDMQDAYAAMLAAAPAAPDAPLASMARAIFGDQLGGQMDAMVGTPTPPATAQDDPITVSLDPDPRGVSVGVWQGSHCIYNGAHAVPVSAQDDAKDERQAFEAWAKKKKMPLARIGQQYDDFWVDHAWNGWQARAALAAPAAGDARAVAALAELVACDRLKKQIASMQACVFETEDDVQELDAMMSDLARRQPAAWDAARAVVAASQQQEG